MYQIMRRATLFSREAQRSQAVESRPSGGNTAENFPFQRHKNSC
jgi:hypothetical protein